MRWRGRGDVRRSRSYSHSSRISSRYLLDGGRPGRSSPKCGARGMAWPCSPLAVVAVILVNGLFSFWQERRAYQALEALQRLLPSAVRVRRDGSSAICRPRPGSWRRDRVGRGRSSAGRLPPDRGVRYARRQRHADGRIASHEAAMHGRIWNSRMTRAPSRATWCWRARRSRPVKDWRSSSPPGCARSSATSPISRKWPRNEPRRFSARLRA